MSLSKTIGVVVVTLLLLSSALAIDEETSAILQLLNDISEKINGYIGNEYKNLEAKKVELASASAEMERGLASLAAERDVLKARYERSKLDVATQEGKMTEWKVLGDKQLSEMSAMVERTVSAHRTELDTIERIRKYIIALKGNNLCKTHSDCDITEYCDTVHGICNPGFASCEHGVMSGAITKSGVYSVRAASYNGVKDTYCKVDEGGWTMVWSNFRDGRSKAETNMKWDTAINTEPIVQGSMTDALNQWKVYTGLSHWKSLSPKGMLRYEWSPNNGIPTNAAVCNYDLEGTEYVLRLSNCKVVLGSVTPGLVSYHNGRPFSTVDRNGIGCASGYSGTPWWYHSCWDGSINGGGENGGHGYFNGAYFISSARSYASAPGSSGAGNGWIYVR